MYKVPASVVSQIMNAYNNRSSTPSPSISGGGQAMSAPSYWGSSPTAIDLNTPTEGGMFDTGRDPSEPSTPYSNEEIANATPMTSDDWAPINIMASIGSTAAGLAGPIPGTLAKAGADILKGATSDKGVNWGDIAKNAAISLGTAGIGRAAGPVLAKEGYKIAGVPGALLGNAAQGKATKGILGFLVNLFGGNSNISNGISAYGPFSEGYQFPGGNDLSYGWSNTLPTGNDDGFNMIGDIATTDIGPFADNYSTSSDDSAYSWTNSLPSDFNMTENATAGSDGSNGDPGGTVICTELRRQGFISHSFYEVEAEYGDTLPCETMEGYRTWAMPIVRLMRKSEIFTRIVMFFAQPVLDEMAHRSNSKYSSSLIGSGALFVALPVCWAIGSLKNARKAKYAC